MWLLFVLLGGNVCVWFDVVLFSFRFEFGCGVLWLLDVSMWVGFGGLLGLLVGCCLLFWVY